MGNEITQEYILSECFREVDQEVKASILFYDSGAKVLIMFKA